MKNMRRALPLILLLPALAACRGTKPVRFGESKFGFSSLIVRGRIITPTGEMTTGKMSLNMESEAADRYRVPFEPGKTVVWRVEPDIYRIHPTRNIFGFVQRDLSVQIAGRNFRVPFPRHILRKEEIDIKPTRIIPLGILEVKLFPIRKGKPPKIIVTLDDSVETRRRLIQEVIDMMIDPTVPVRVRSAAISWTRALQGALLDVVGEQQEEPAYKSAR